MVRILRMPEIAISPARISCQSSARDTFSPRLKTDDYIKTCQGTLPVCGTTGESAGLSLFPTRRKFLQLSAAGAACGALADCRRWHSLRSEPATGLFRSKLPFLVWQNHLTGTNRSTQRSSLRRPLLSCPSAESNRYRQGVAAGPGCSDWRLCHLSRPGPHTAGCHTSSQAG